MGWFTKRKEIAQDVQLQKVILREISESIQETEERMNRLPDLWDRETLREILEIAKLNYTAATTCNDRQVSAERAGKAIEQLNHIIPQINNHVENRGFGY